MAANPKKKLLVLADVLLAFTKCLQQLEASTLQKVLEWIVIWTRYITWEPSFSPARNRQYNRGDLVDVNFGFNVGAELGGRHWAVVIECGNKRSDGTLTVIPLSSLDPDEDESVLTDNEMYLGVIPGFINNERAFAKVKQIIAISKLRILSPCKAKDLVYSLPEPMLKKIEKRLLEKLIGNLIQDAPSEVPAMSGVNSSVSEKIS